MLRGVIKIIKDFLFPVFCVECGCEGVWFCKQCKRRTKVRPFVFYSPVKDLCFGIGAFFPYTTSVIWGKLIGFWKYNFVEEISTEWNYVISQERLFLARYLNNFNRSQPIYLVPVPLHPRRLRERGFNQAKVLADILEKYFVDWGFQVQVLECLKRARHTSQQARLSPTARQKNLQGAFVWEQKNNVPEQVILVDDVFTTGFTACECVQVLQTKGVKKIGMIVLAHG